MSATYELYRCPPPPPWGAQVGDLIAALNAFRALAAVRNLFHADDGSLLPCVTSPMLSRVVDSAFPDLQPQLDAFARSFDVEEAQKRAKVTPAPGVNTDYDEAVADGRAIVGELEAYLSKQRAALKCPSMEYWGTAKDRYQLEVPEELAP